MYQAPSAIASKFSLISARHTNGFETGIVWDLFNTDCVCVSVSISVKVHLQKIDDRLPSLPFQHQVSRTHKHKDEPEQWGLWNYSVSRCIWEYVDCKMVDLRTSLSPQFSSRTFFPMKNDKQESTLPSGYLYAEKNRKLHIFS